MKQRLAREIVARFYDAEKAAGAEAYFDRVVTAGEIPDDVPEHRVLPDQLKEGRIWIVRLLVDAGLAASNGEARRLIVQGGVKINGQPVTDASLDWRGPGRCGGASRASGSSPASAWGSAAAGSAARAPLPARRHTMILR